MMIINLKQTEIVAALKGYISKQGINLNGKEVTIAFTAGRKESGISAELTIEDAEGIPGFIEPEFEAPVLTLVTTMDLPVPLAADPVVDAPVEVAVVVEDPVVEPAAEAQVEAVKTTSLFG